MAKAPVMTSDFVWQKIPQTRISVQVDKVIQLITNPPRPVTNMPLADWSLIVNNGQTSVRHATGLVCGYHQYKLPHTLQGAFPVLVGTGNGKVFLIDGAHRVAKGLMDGRVAIPAVILTEAETRACLRSGMQKRFDAAVGLPIKP